MHSSTDSDIPRFGVLIFITIDLHIHHHLALSPHAPHAPHAATQMCDTCCRLMRPTRPARRHRCVTLAVASWAPRADTQGNITSQTSTTSQAYTRARLSLVCIAPMTSQAGFISQANIHSQCSPVLLTRTCVFEKAPHRTCWHQFTGKLQVTHMCAIFCFVSSSSSSSSSR